MAKKHSLISGGSRSAAAILKKAKQEPPVAPAVDISEEAILKRTEERNTFPDQPLKVTYSCRRARADKPYEVDFSDLAEKYPHHLILIKQFLVGINLVVRDGLAQTTFDKYFNALKSLIIFLNDHKNLLDIDIRTCAAIDATVFLAYKTYLTSNFPSSTSNRKYYSSMSKALKALHSKYSNDFLIGESTPLPRPPKRNGKAIEGYNANQIRELIKCCLKDIKAIRKFHVDYNALNDQSSQINLDTNGPIGWQKDPDQFFMTILATIKNKWPEYPYYMPLAEIKPLFDHCQIRNMLSDKEAEARRRISSSLAGVVGKISFMDGKLGRSAIYAAQHFVADTIYPFLLLPLILTGFNGECLKYMPDDLEFISDDPLDPDNYAIIYGYKNKTEKLIPVRCKKKQANGVYGLLQYVASVIEKFKDSEHYVQGALFQFTMQNLGNKTLVSTFHGKKFAFSMMGRRFVERHGLQELIGPTIEDGKLRKAYSSIAYEGGLSVGDVAKQLGHSDADGIPETTDRHYLVGSAPIAVKNKAIKNIQEKLVSDIQNYKHRIVTCKTLQQIRDAINSAKNEAERDKKIRETARELNLEEKVVVHLLDAGVQTYILVCEDMNNPTWPGHEEHVKNGPCRQYNKCCLCGQAVVFPEALPYIAKRIMDVEAAQSTMTAIEWVANFGDERDAWRLILDEWNNDAQVACAWEAARSGEISLPKVMKGGTR